MNELFKAQIERETLSKKRAEEKLEKDRLKNEKIANASNNIYGIKMKQEFLGAMIAKMQEQRQRVTSLRSGYKMSERYAVLQECLGVVFERYKGQKTATTQDLFDEELACHVALQVAIDAVMLPDRPKMGGRKTTRTFDGVRPTMAELQWEVSQQLWRQMYYKLVHLNFNKWFSKQHDKARGSDAAKSSPHYVHNSLDWHIENFAEYCRSQNDERSDVFQFRKWNYREAEIIGSWLVSLLKETGLFKQVKSKKSGREFTLELTAGGKEIVDDINAQVTKFAALPLPMLIEPAPMTKQFLGGWIGDAAILNGSTNGSWKGEIQLSDKHIDFYNHQQRQGFRINQFTWEILQELERRNQQLGKFKMYKKQRLIPMWQELEIPAYEWDRCITYEDQNKLIRADEAKYKAAKRARSKRYTQEQSKKVEGQPSEYLFEMAKECAGDEAFYIPIEPDFRSRFTCRTSYLNYQGNDVARGLLEFAKGYDTKNDPEAKRFLSIHLANQAGMDKETYASRINWVESHLGEIEAVALMTAGDDQEFDEGIALIKELADDEFQFAAACREYYELFIARTKTVTHLPCAIDATCSGQQLIAGFLRSAELAERVNVLPTLKPGDIYRDTMDKMLELADADDTARFRPSTRKALKGGIGRKMSKKGFMSGQYGSGTERQLKDMFEYIDNDTTLKIEESERGLIKKYWADALEAICKIRVVFNWFQDLVQEIHDNGGNKVVIPTPTGSKIIQRYPVPKTTKVQTFSFGSSEYKPSETNVQIPSDSRNLGKWKTATAANTIHGAGDAALLCHGLSQFEYSFYCVHDSISTYCGQPLKQLQNRLKRLTLML